MKRLPYILLALYFIAGLFTIFFFDGTGDHGDSEMHFLFSKYAPLHPELYFHHWAKPFFVLLSSPFAQLGFSGMKFFNLLAGTLSAYYTWRIAVKLNIPNAVFSILFLVFCPLNFVMTFSGLTEPLFAFLLIFSLFQIVSDKPLLGAFLASFLPFVRSEGLIIIAVLLFFFLLHKNWRAMGYLFLGHLLYSLAGFFIYQDLLWVFTKIPYATAGSVYGSGSLFHFVDRFYYVIGLPIYILFALGLLKLLIDSWNKKKINFSDVRVLIPSLIFSYILAHTLFWYLGIFNSMGLKRVLIAILPLTAIVSLYGFNLISELKWIPSKVQVGIKYGLLIYVLVFPFTKNPAAINWERDLSLTTHQLLSEEIGSYIQEHRSPENKIISSTPHLLLALNVDHFDPSQHLSLDERKLKQMNPGDWLLWDRGSGTYTGIGTPEKLAARPGLEKISEHFQEGADEPEFVLFRYVSFR